MKMDGGNRWWGTALRLGRVSNLPTVWTNVMAGVALGGGALTAGLIVPVAVAMSLAYVAGMYLNDAFDRRWDAQHRPERPIPAGQVSARTVFSAGFGMMAVALLILLLGPGGGRAFPAGLTLAALIVFYDISHKSNPFGPVIMGLCRVAVYLTAARAAVPGWRPTLFVGAAFLLAYLIMLSTIARRETQDPRLARLVGPLIAGIALVDGAQLLALGQPFPAGLCVVAFVLARLLQRRVPGT
jgi:4-hydroxybenzoate polyprenyltransferase